jgi:hypothetical protein
MSLNQTARPEFLADFLEEDLLTYMEHLEAVSGGNETDQTPATPA